MSTKMTIMEEKTYESRHVFSPDVIPQAHEHRMSSAGAI